MAAAALEKNISVEIVTPSGVEYGGTVEGLVVPGEEGYLGIRPGHAPLMAGLQPGVVTLHLAETDHYAAVSGGAMEVFENRVTVLADTAESAPEIDIARAREAMERAKRRLQMPHPARAERGIDTDRAHAALLRATARLRTAEKAGRAESHTGT
ncbi:MAG: ATP synthase F1 subunit epsilon [Armatimonadota bacterium]